MVKKDWRHQTHKRAAIIFDQMQRMLALAPDADQRAEFLDDPNNAYFSKLDEIYGEEFQLAQLMDTSDIIFHAEGPAVKELAPQLKALNWLTSVTEKALRGLGRGVFDAMAMASDTKTMAKQLDLRCTGIAPGSMYAGFSLEHRKNTMYGISSGKSDPVIAEIIEAYKRLTVLPHYIKDDRVDGDIVELVDDPALRDSLLVWAHKLCPTGRMGIHTLEISDENNRPAHYSERERIVLRDALKKPVTKFYEGNFPGEIRQADLDKGRFQLRNVPDLGSLRCVASGKDVDISRLFGKRCFLGGQYETDHNGRPRLFYVNKVIKVIDAENQTPLKF